MNKNTIKNSFQHLLLLLTLSIFLLYPALKDNISSDSPGYVKHIITLQLFHNNILSDIFFPEWASGLGKGYGYPVFVFRPPLIYWLQEVLRIFFIIPSVSIKIITMFAVVFSTFIIFQISSLFFKGKGAVISSITYIFSPLLLNGVLYKSNYDEILMIFLLPLNLLLIGRLADCRGKAPDNNIFFYLTASMTALFLSTPATFLSFSFLTIWGLITFAMSPETAGKKNIYTLISSILLSAAISSFYWLPAYSERNLVYGTASLRKLNLPAVPYLISPESAGIAAIALASAGIGLTLIRGKVTGKNRFLIPIGVISLLIIFFEKYLNNSNTLINADIALPLMILTVLSILSGAVFSEKDKGIVSNVIFILFIAVLLISMRSDFLKIKSEINPSADKQITSSKAPYRIWRQYMPAQVKEIPKKDFYRPLKAVSGQVKVLREDFSPEKRGIRLKAGKGGCRARLNLFYYPGWGLSIKDVPLRPDGIDISGRIIVAIPEGVNFLRIRFNNTFIHNLSDLISYFAVVFFYLIFIYYKKP